MGHDTVPERLEDIEISRTSLRNRKGKQRITQSGKRYLEKDLDDRNERKISHFYKQCPTEVGGIPELTKRESSTSLVLQKTTERNVLEQYSFLSYASILQQHESESDILNSTLDERDKPLVKVTVIPKSIYTQTSGICDCNTKTVENTLSGCENNYKTKNIYLVVAGKKKEKVYELKTKGSGKIASNIFYNKDVSVQRVTGLSRFIDNLNMEKKKKKDKRKKDTKSRDKGAVDFKVHNECPCGAARQTFDKDKIESPKSRVRITGHLGITEDDRYVLNCAATVDGQPVTNCVDVKRNLTVAPVCISAKEMHQTPQFQLGYMSNYANTSKFTQESRETQVNFTSNIPHNDQTVQCNCSFSKSQFNPLNVAEKESDILIGDNNVKDSQSVVVVISVYPKQETLEKPQHEDDISDKLRLVTTQANNVNSNIKYNKNFIQEQQQHTTYQSRTATDIKKKPIPYSRSPSPPVKLPAKTKTYEGKLEVNKKVPKSRSVSPNSRNPTASYNKSVQQKLESPESKKRTKNAKAITETKINNNKPFPNLRMKVNRTKDNKSTNTDLAMTKKMLIDEFLNESITNIYRKENVKRGTSRKNNDISNVSVNIKGEHENYDVQYRQGVISTDLQVRKTVKHNPGECNVPDNSSSPSMENFFNTNNERCKRNRSFSQTIFDIPPNITLDKLGVTLNVRDSLEINHRREGKSSASIKLSDLDDMGEEEHNDSDVLVPVKHYRGDKCSITDPIERDKQIRELLGVDKPRRKSPLKSTQEHTIEDNRSLLNILRQSGENLISNKKIQTLCKNKKIQCKIQSTSADVPMATCKQSISTQYETNGFVKQLDRMYVNNVQTLLQSHITGNRPIVLSRQQYEKMKKALQIKLSRKRCCKRCSGVSVGEIRKKIKRQASLHYDKEVQTDQIELKSKQIQQTSICYKDPSENSEPMAALSDERVVVNKEEEINEFIDLSRIIESNDRIKNINKAKVNLPGICNQSHEEPNNELDLINNTLENCSAKMDEVKLKKSPRQTVSSIEIHYASIAYKHVTFSRSTIGDYWSPTRSLSVRDTLLDKSIHTIYKRQRKSLTPNLGTSAFSLFEDPGYEAINAICNTQELKVRKPLLKRLMSYLVMRSTRVADVKIGRKQEGEVRNPRSFDSVDSYLINSSLGEMEITSSLYDTSASFFSNHAIYPVNSKIKRGFLSSVRGLLSNRK